jgi:[ribosomal protein S5]-alanine N-acetyltransferase
MSNFETERLSLQSIQLSDFEFIKQLVNTEGWITYIGDRNIHSDEEAQNYIQKITSNECIKYWVVRLKNERISIGIITFIKRDYLAFHDIGFAFLPQFGKNGYGFEATNTVLKALQINGKHSEILATTVPTNTKSISLLEKLGFYFQEEIEQENEKLLVYSNLKK